MVESLVKALSVDKAWSVLVDLLHRNSPLSSVNSVEMSFFMPYAHKVNIVIYKYVYKKKIEIPQSYSFSFVTKLTATLQVPITKIGLCDLETAIHQNNGLRPTWLCSKRNPRPAHLVTHRLKNCFFLGILALATVLIQVKLTDLKVI